MLRGIVEVMRSCNTCVAMCFRQLVEEIITDFTGGHLNGHLMGFGIISGVCMALMAMNTKRIAGFLYQLFIGKRRGAPQTEVDMGHCHLVSSAHHQMEKGHRIQPAAHCHQHRVGLGTKVVLTDKPVEASFHAAKIRFRCIDSGLQNALITFVQV